MIKLKDETKDGPKGSAGKTRTAPPSGKVAREVGRRLDLAARSTKALARTHLGAPAVLDKQTRADLKRVATAAVTAEGPFIPTTYSLDQGLIDRVSDWAHEKRLSKSAAARALLGQGLK